MKNLKSMEEFVNEGIVDDTGGEGLESWYR